MPDSVVKDSIPLSRHDQTGRTARQFVIRTLRRWRVVELIFRASQVVTELVERVAARSGRDMTLVLIRGPRSVRIEVLRRLAGRSREHRRGEQAGVSWFVTPQLGASASGELLAGRGLMGPPCGDSATHRPGGITRRYL